MNHRFFYIFFAVLYSIPSHAQYLINGYLINEDKEPIIGAVVELDKKQICISDKQGYFVLKTPEEKHLTLEVSYLGYEKTKITVFPPKWTADTTLQLIPQIEAIQTVEIKAERLEDQNAHTLKIDKDYLDKNRGGTFAHSLENIAGINTINTGVGIAKPVIRGFTGQRIVVAQSGVKQEGQQWGNDHGLEIDPFSVEEVNIVKGAASLRYGSDAVGGAIEILPSRIIAKNSYQSELIGLYKSNNVHGAGSFSTKMRWDKLMVYGQVSMQSFGDYRVPADSFVYNGFKLPIYNQRLKNTAG